MSDSLKNVLLRYLKQAVVANLIVKSDKTRAYSCIRHAWLSDQPVPEERVARSSASCVHNVSPWGVSGPYMAEQRQPAAAT